MGRSIEKAIGKRIDCGRPFRNNGFERREGHVQWIRAIPVLLGRQMRRQPKGNGNGLSWYWFVGKSARPFEEHRDDR